MGRPYVGPLCDLLFLRTPLSHQRVIKRSDVLSEPFAVTRETVLSHSLFPSFGVALEKKRERQSPRRQTERAGERPVELSPQQPPIRETKKKKKKKKTLLGTAVVISCDQACVVVIVRSRPVDKRWRELKMKNKKKQVEGG